MKKLNIFLIFFILIFSFFTYIYLYKANIYTNFDDILKDEMFLIRGKIPTQNKVVIVDIDEKSLKILGQWPWSRDIISQILVNLTNAQTAVIGLDMFFAEKDMKSPSYLANKYKAILPNDYNINYDELFAYVLSQTPTIMGYFFDLEHNITKNILPNIPAIFIQKNFSKEYLINAKGYIGNLKILQQNAYSGGYVNMIPDNDGVVRRVPMLIKYNNIIYPSLAFEMYRAYKGIKKVIINYSDAGIDNIKLNSQIIKTDRFGNLFVNYRGSKGQFKYISAVDVYNNNFSKNIFKNKFVLIGTSASGLFDLRVTPFDKVYPGVEVHANVIDNLLKGDIIYRPDFAEFIDIGLLLLSGIISIIIFYFFTPLLAVFLMITYIVLYFEGIYYFMFYKGFIFELILPIFETIILGIIFITINYFLEIKQTKILKEKFSKKVSHSVMQELLSNQNELSPKEQEVSIFFSDIRDFTTISENISNPNQIIELLNFYMTPMSDIIISHKGTIDKFIGDAIMAYWNAPIKISNHADEAVSSAIEQLHTLKQLIPIIKNKFNIDLNIGIGINTGNVTIGEMGSIGRADYTIIGDNVNLASRLENLNKVYNTNIIISEYTFKKLKNNYIIRKLDFVKVKGKNKPVAIYEVQDFGIKDFSLHNKALNLYQQANFKEALVLFQKLFNQTNDNLYLLYIKRCEYLINHPPKNFDGVWVY